jgi:hypothetical protein
MSWKFLHEPAETDVFLRGTYPINPPRIPLWSCITYFVSNQNMLLRNPEYNYDKRENNFFIFQLAKTFVASYSLKYSAICFHIQKCLAYTPPPPPNPTMYMLVTALH